LSARELEVAPAHTHSPRIHHSLVCKVHSGETLPLGVTRARTTNLQRGIEAQGGLSASERRSRALRRGLRRGAVEFVATERPGATANSMATTNIADLGKLLTDYETYMVIDGTTRMAHVKERTNQKFVLGGAAFDQEAATLPRLILFMGL